MRCKLKENNYCLFLVALNLAVCKRTRLNQPRSACKRACQIFLSLGKRSRLKQWPAYDSIQHTLALDRGNLSNKQTKLACVITKLHYI